MAYLHAQAGQPDLERTAGLTVPPGPLLLTGYSQGSVIAPAVIAQLPAEVLRDVALLTLACPARRLYGRAFPAYFGPRQLAALAGLLDASGTPGQPREDGQPAGRWKNLRRRSDYIGSWVFAEPRAPAQRRRPARQRRPALLGSRASWSRTRTRPRRRPIATPDGGKTRAPASSGNTSPSCSAAVSMTHGMARPRPQTRALIGGDDAE